MSFRKLSLTILSVIIMFSMGCREVRYYAYKAPTVDILGGEFSVNLEGSYSENYEKDGKKLADWGFPYTLQFIYSAPKENKLQKMIVKDIRLTGERTAHQFNLSSVESSRVRTPSDYGLKGDEKIIRASSSIIASDNYQYESYTLEATVVVYEDADSFKEEPVMLKIETDYRKERRSDWFDEKTSI